MATAKIKTHINDLVKVKIPALGGRGAKSNRLILENIALNGPLLKYDVFKNLETKGLDRYSTVSRRIDDLKKRGYLAEAGKRPTERGKQEEETMYALTWRGFIASLSIKEVRENIFQVLEKNPLLKFPEKEFVLLVFKELYTREDFEAIATPLFHAYVKAIPNLEDIREEHLLLWLTAIKEFPSIPEEVKQKTDLSKLLGNPKVLEYVKEKFLPVIDAWEKQTYESWLAIKEINNELKKYVETKLLGE